MGEMWTVPCVDGVGRDRRVTVRVAHDRVLLTLPPAEAAVFIDGQAGLLGDVLDVASDALAVDAARRRR